MSIRRFLLLSAGLFLILFQVKGSEKEVIKTLDIAELVLQKGLKTVDLGLYPGVLLLEGMSELALVHPDRKEELLAQTIGLLKKFKTKEIEGRGSFISYEAGGNGAAYLYFKKVADELGPQVLDGAKRMMETQKRSTEGLLVPHWGTENKVFIDMTFGVSPFLLYSGLALNRPDYVDMAVKETLELFRILEDKETGLLHQGRGFQGPDVISQDNWSRGNGWGALAVSNLVRDLPESHQKRAEVERLAVSFFKTAMKYQDTNGLWHQEITDKSSYVETSGSGLLLYGLGIMLEKGLLEKGYKKNLEKGLSGYMRYTESDGSVSNACKGNLCPGNGTKEDYKKSEWVLNDPHAFGPVVLAFTQAYKIGINTIKPLK
jgi:rhamnogalacturonyl hydrolase YesR